MTDYRFLGPYRVEARLGQGGMGTVYRGVHVKTGQRVAVKVLASQVSHEARFRRRFDAEIETLKKLNHPNIVRLIGFGEEQGSLFYSMELVDGPSLLEHLRRVKRLDWDTAIGFGIEICAALKHAHDFGVIHRDLKPANLLIEPTGRLKLTDFGIAKLFGSTEQTAAGAVLGTADYMAPEQASGGPITPRTDLYALGSLMYACLVGRPPFGGRDLTQVVHGLKHETPAPIDLVLPDVPPELAELVHELLEKTPENRPPTALAVGKRLGALRAGLRRRGEKTHYDLGAPTIPEPELGTEAESSPLRAARRSAADEPTAAEHDSLTRTGAAEVGLAPTIASRDSAGVSAKGSTSRRTSAAAEPSASPPPRSHFEAVGAEPPDAWPDGAPPWDARHWISVVVLLLMLGAAGGAILWMMRVPSADEVMAAITRAEAADDEQAYEDAVEAFLRLHPDDPRAAPLRESLAATDVEQMARRLRRQAALRGGVEFLDPAEQAWLEAIARRANHPAGSADALRQWLDVFGHAGAKSDTGPGSAMVARLAELARLEAERLEAQPTVPDPRVDRLREWIQWGTENLHGDERQRFVTAVRELYADKPWAADLLENLPAE